LRFLPEPAFRHDAVPRVGVLLVNLGTPRAPTRAAVRAYLKEFLWDPRVVEIPRPIWWLVLNGIILNVRPGESARKYASIWTKDGSPLMVYTARQATMLRGFLGDAVRQPIEVAFAMRYGAPSVDSALEQLRAAGCTRVLAVPLYPQYAASTTASACDRLFAVLERIRNVPELRIVKHFHDHPAYVHAVAERIRAHWAKNGRPDVLVMSFHGLPRLSLERGDPYHCECHASARLIATALGLSESQWQLGFQSRFGRAQWLTPYTSDVLTELGKRKTGRVDVACPGFVADCLETLEEIGIEAKHAFAAAGGGELQLISCLNDSDAWMRALTQIVREHLGNWIDPQWSAQSADRVASERQARARALGAKQ
jgi:ferrochelatase